MNLGRSKFTIFRLMKPTKVVPTMACSGLTCESKIPKCRVNSGPLAARLGGSLLSETSVIGHPPVILKLVVGFQHKDLVALAHVGAASLQ